MSEALLQVTEDWDGLDTPAEAIAVTAVTSTGEILQIIERLPCFGNFSLHILNHAAFPIDKGQGVLLFELRMMEAFEDLDWIRKFRQHNPLRPLVAICANDDEDFIAEIFKAGASVLHLTATPPLMLAEHVRSLFKLGEASRLVEIQNEQMLQSMAAERDAIEARFQAEAAQKIAQTQAEANQKTKEILDHLPEGFFILEADQTVAVASASCQRIFQNDILGGRIGSLLNLKGDQETFFQNGLDQLFEDFMPLGVSLSLLPKQLTTTSGRAIRLHFTPVLKADQSPQKLIVTASDISDYLQEQEVAAQDRRLKQTLLRLVADREALRDFINESKTALELLENDPTPAAIKRTLHTLKGNAAVMGLEALATFVHEQESELDKEDLPADFPRQAAMGIRQEFLAFLNQHASVLQISWDKPAAVYELKEEDLKFLNSVVRTHQSAAHGKALRILDRLVHRSVKSLLPDFEVMAARLSRNLGKNLRFVLHGGQIRLDPARLNPLMKTLVHALRNACDHGIESPEIREQAGKPVQGLVRFRFEKAEDSALLITIQDDGAGIPLQKIIRRARDKGLVQKGSKLTRTQALQLIFHQGLSTADAVSDISGRGVGMSCIHFEVEKLGGTIELASEESKGTRCRIRIPGVFQSDPR